MQDSRSKVLTNSSAVEKSKRHVQKELIEKQNALCKEFNEYVDTLKKKGKIFYD